MSAEPVAQAWTPLCFEPDELAGWQEMRARSTSYHDRTARPCTDCLAGFAADMHKAISPEYPEGRCNGTPKGDEDVDDLDRPSKANIVDVVALRGRSITRAVALDVAAPPCASCAHEPICVLRLALEDVGTVETAAPPLPAGLRLSLVATVECDHYLRDRAKPAPVRVLTSEQRRQAALAAGRTAISSAGRAAMREAGINNLKKAREAKAAAREGGASA